MLIYKHSLAGYDKNIPLFFTRSGSVWICLTLMKDIDENPISCTISFYIHRQSSMKGPDFSDDIFSTFKGASKIFECSIYEWPEMSRYLFKYVDEDHKYLYNAFKTYSWFDKNGGYPTYLRLSSKIRAFIKHRLKFKQGLDPSIYIQYKFKGDE